MLWLYCVLLIRFCWAVIYWLCTRNYPWFFHLFAWKYWSLVVLFCELLDSPRAKAGGLAFEVILKPASADNPPAIISNSPPKERSISQEFIEKKLKDAEERRQVWTLRMFLINLTGFRYSKKVAPSIINFINAKPLAFQLCYDLIECGGKNNFYSWSSLFCLFLLAKLFLNQIIRSFWKVNFMKCYYCHRCNMIS